MPAPDGVRGASAPFLGQESRIRRVFAVGADNPLPEVNAESTARYRKYLGENLTFPFSAEFYDERDGDVCGHPVTATRLVDDGGPAPAASGGIECEVLVWGGPVTVSLCELRPGPYTANRRLIDDYRYWLRSQR